ncbi:hypothetical protein DL93DRAFT_2225426 [Clavulina sp. PMI_390]|nr:hypothetical protein DL93DRAFT_2225426 [Clavulina sp. PMI_390]
MGLFTPRKEASSSRSQSLDPSSSKSRWFPSSNRNSRVYDSESSYGDVSPGPSSVGASPYATMSRVAPSSAYASHQRQRSTDRATVSLAQRLNELATANADGLLEDEEYRLLRQNLFERFGAASQVPTESPIVKLSPPDPPPANPRSRSSSNARHYASSQHADPSETSRPPSVISTSSRVSTITSALRNALLRQPSLSKQQPASAGPASTSFHFNDSSSQRGLRHQTSSHSLKSSAASVSASSSVPHFRGSGAGGGDAHSISSYHTGFSSRTGRTSGSRGPPSSYHHHPSTPGRSGRKGKSVPTPSVHSGNGVRVPLELDGEDTSAADIRDEILAVEAEKRGLMEGFEGLAMSAAANPGPNGGSRRSGSLSSSKGKTLKKRKAQSSDALREANASASLSAEGDAKGKDKERPSSIWTVTPDTHRLFSDPSSSSQSQLTSSPLLLSPAQLQPMPPPSGSTAPASTQTLRSASTPLPSSSKPPPKPLGPSIAERKRSLGMLSAASAKFSRSRDYLVSPPSPLPQSATLAPSRSTPSTPSKGSGNTSTAAASAAAKVTEFFRRRGTPKKDASGSGGGENVPPVPSVHVNGGGQQQQSKTTAPTQTQSLKHKRSKLHKTGPANGNDADPATIVLSPDQEHPHQDLGQDGWVEVEEMEDPEEDPALREIRKRKEETAARYDQRLEFLRAKLKGAELKERLIR